MHAGKMGRVAEAQRTRDALIAAATQLFVEQGLSEPSLDAICARAGFTRGAFYVHFRTRDELIAAVVESAMGGFIDAMMQSGEAGADLRTIVRTFAAVLRAGPLPFVGQVRGHQIMEACFRSQALRQKYNELLAHARDRLSDMVRRGQVAGTIRGDVDPHAVAQLLLALVLGAHTASEIGAPYDADRVGEDVLRMLAPIEVPPARKKGR